MVTNDVFLPFDTNPSYDSQIPTVKFSYTFEQPERATVQVEDFVVTFIDLVGIVGGTLGMFIGFAFYDNIMTFVEYVLTFVQWVKRLNLKRRTRKVAKVQVQEDPSTRKKEAKSEPSSMTTKEKDANAGMNLKLRQYCLKSC